MFPHTLMFGTLVLTLGMLRLLLFSGAGVQGDNGGPNQSAWGRDNNGKHGGILRREDRQRATRESFLYFCHGCAV